MLIERVKKTIEEHKLLKKEQHIVLGLSGGPDSVCLFHVLIRLARQMDLNIYPVHINHKLRPKDAENDQKYVEELCEKMGVECRTVEKDCNALAAKLGTTSENAGRIVRYDAFCNMAEEIVSRLSDGGMTREEAIRNVKIAVAHNANDQAETILFRLLRGTGTDGLAGIAYKRKERDFDVIRPILDIYRDDIEAYCEKNELFPAVDHTNSQPIYARNKIRLELIPFIEDGYNINIKEALVRLGRIAAEDKDFLWQETERAYDTLIEDSGDKESKIAMSAVVKGDEDVADRNIVIMDRERLSRLHDAIRHRVIMKAFGSIGLEKDISEERIKAADAIINKKQAPKTVEFPHGYKLKVEKGRVFFLKS